MEDLLDDEPVASTYVVESSVEITTEPIASLVRTITAAKCMPRGPHQHGHTGVEKAFFALFEAAPRETLLELLGHESVVLRGYLIEHIVDDLPEEMERLYPLFRDDRRLEVLRGCHLDPYRVGGLLAVRLRVRADRRGVGRGRAFVARNEARRLLTRAVLDTSLPAEVRAVAVANWTRLRLEGVPSLVRDLLRDEEPALAAAAMGAVACLPRDELLVAIRAGREHPSPRVRAVAERQAPEFEAAFKRTLRGGMDWWFETFARECPEAVGKPPAEAFLVAAEHGPPDLRASMLSVQWEKDPADALPRILREIDRTEKGSALSLALATQVFRWRSPEADAIARKLLSLEGPAAGEYYFAIQNALNYVADFRLHEYLSDVRRHLVSSSASRQEYAAETVAELDDMDAVPLLEAMLASEWDSVVSAGARALATLGSRDSLPKLRVAFARLGSPDALAKLHEALQSARKRYLGAIERAIQTLSEE